MPILNPYLCFNGNCEEAFNFYKSIFGGEFIYFARFSEMPKDDPNCETMSDEDANKVMHVSLPLSKETVLMGCDNPNQKEKPTNFGDNISLTLNAKDKSEADRLYSALSQKGIPMMPMSDTFWGSYFGMLQDQFGINWMIDYSEMK